MSGDTITLLRSRGPRLAKLVRADGQIVGYDDCRTYHGTERAIAGIEGLFTALTWLSGQPSFCVVRGALVSPTRKTPMRRLLYADPESGEQPTLRETPHHWLATDWDSIEAPAKFDVADLAACATTAIALLPKMFHGVACIVQATGSHGIAPGIRVRLWHWLDRPVDGAELKRWLGNVSGIDASVFRPAQVIYTAAPVFEGGRDHLPKRLQLLPGAPCVVTPPPAALAPPERRPTAITPLSAGNRRARYAFSALRNALARVNAAGTGARHPTILNEARSLARFVKAGLLDEADVKGALADAARNVGKPDGEADKIFAWAMAHASTVEIPAGASNG